MDIKTFNIKESYSDRQWAFLEIFIIAFNAIKYNYTDTLKPTPGRSINIKNALKDIANVENEWKIEWEKRDKTGIYSGVPNFSKMPEEAQLWMYEALNNIRETYQSDHRFDDWEYYIE